ncbi:MAG TPA: HlyD family efflux transporter periplasmic adaptor subunit [Polyangiaceae bacterium]|nr:HlyD family efflux transporter periplasmic adaptor subunit [Polyangiaceae bacterium]
MSSDRRNPKDRSKHSATVVAGTPVLARNHSTAPLGGRRKGISASHCVDVEATPQTVADAGSAAAPLQSSTPTTPGGPVNLLEALTARRAGLWETVVGVGPFQRDRTAVVARPAAPSGEPAPSAAAAQPAASAEPAPSAAQATSAAHAPFGTGPTGTQASVPSPVFPRSRSARRGEAPASAASEAGVESQSPVRVLRRPAPPASESAEARSPARPEAPSREAPSRSEDKAAPQVESGPGLFRKAALDARRGDAPEVDFLAGFKPKGWSVLLLLASLVGLLFLGAALAKVEVNAEAQGMLRAPRGLRPVASVLGGSISEVLVQSGDQVQQGQVVARLEATELRAALVNRERELATTQREVTEADKRDRQIEERASQAMQRRRAALQARVDVNRERLAQRRKQADNYAELVREGGASQDQSLNIREALNAASENVSALSAELAQLDLEIADRARQWQERDTARRSQLARAEASVEEARTILASTEVRAPASGQIESVLATPGNVVEAGGLLGNVVPSGAPRTIVAFVPSRDIAFVTPGASATVEVQSLPISEFGLGKAVVTRVSSDVATPTEVQATLGETLQGTVVRVELELTDSETSAQMEPHLRSGDRVTIRLHRRERRVITLLFDFVRRWVQ